MAKNWFWFVAPIPYIYALVSYIFKIPDMEVWQGGLILILWTAVLLLYYFFGKKKEKSLEGD